MTDDANNLAQMPFVASAVIWGGPLALPPPPTREPSEDERFPRLVNKLLREGHVDVPMPGGSLSKRLLDEAARLGFSAHSEEHADYWGYYESIRLNGSPPASPPIVAEIAGAREEAGARHARDLERWRAEAVELLVRELGAGHHVSLPLAMLFGDPDDEPKLLLARVTSAGIEADFNGSTFMPRGSQLPLSMRWRTTTEGKEKLRSPEQFCPEEGCLQRTYGRYCTAHTSPSRRWHEQDITEKAQHPEDYCPEPNCMHRTGGGRCPIHKAASQPSSD